jgi:benzoyl-CoA reductase/2-hydroxyglutaryl-CoA dehydratase subunit BcrC/BadD/HgdB
VLATVLYSSPFVPPEWIQAHGLRSCRGCAQEDRRGCKPGAPMGVCAYAESFLDEALAWDGPVIFSTLCDQMRRAADHCFFEAGPDKAFLFNVPSTWQTEAARQLYRQELERLGKFLVRHGGRKPETAELREVMRRFAQEREKLLRTGPMLSAREFAEAVAEFHRGASAGLRKTRTQNSGVPVGLVGGPLLFSHFELLDRVEGFGGRIVFNGTLVGERGLLPSSFGDAWEEDPFGALAGQYFASVPDVARRPNGPFYDWTRSRLKETGAEGIIVWHYAWCDLWRAEANRLRDELNLPVLDLDAGDASEFTAQTRNRVEAFIETLAGK